MSELRPNLEASISRIVGILADAVTQSGMSKDDCDDLREALRQFVAAVKS